MRTLSIRGQDYRLPSHLNAFQQETYIHLINWKWQHGIFEVGTYKGQEYDAIIPESYAGSYPILYPDIVGAMKEHIQRFPFRIHKHFDHMASSQAANINLFLPILRHEKADAILAKIKPDLDRIAADQLDNGYRIEFWDGKAGSSGKGLLGDHCRRSGTDSDIAIAYYNHQGELCLWLIEHKLTESEFTTCGGFRSKGRKLPHDCRKNFEEILADKKTCYYHDVRRFNYWNITEANRDFFPGYVDYEQCPFQGGMNQLWRNQLLALAVESDERQPYRHVFFSVARHPGNEALCPTIDAYRNLVGNSKNFSVFTSADVIHACEAIPDDGIQTWANWYCDLYNIVRRRH